MCLKMRRYFVTFALCKANDGKNRLRFAEREKKLNAYRSEIGKPNRLSRLLDAITYISDSYFVFLIHSLFSSCESR